MKGLLCAIFFLSASAMDSDNPIIPGMICTFSGLLLLWESRRGNVKKRKSLLQQAQSIKQISISVFIITRRKENAMVKCSVCGYNFDNGELINHVCPDCIEKEKLQEIREVSVPKMMQSQSYQMKLRLEEMRNG